MKTRRHHNNKGLRGIKTGTYEKSLYILCKKLKIPFEGKFVDYKVDNKEVKDV